VQLWIRRSAPGRAPRLPSMEMALLSMILIHAIQTIETVPQGVEPK